MAVAIAITAQACNERQFPCSSNNRLARVSPDNGMGGEAAAMSQARFNFDAAAGEIAKAKGMDFAALNKAERLKKARLIAVELAGRLGEITADDVQKVMIELDIGPLGNAAGRLFLLEDWEFTGERRKSPRKSNHRHENRVWRLRRKES